MPPDPRETAAPARPLDQVPAFRYVTVENAPTYRAILEVFVESKERYVIELRPAEIRERLSRSGLFHELPDEGALDRHLDQLAEWRNLQRSHDTGAVPRVEDFYRRRWLYRLTPEGEAAHRAVREVEATVGRSGALQTSMLVEIRDALAALCAAGGAAPRGGAHRRLLSGACQVRLLGGALWQCVGCDGLERLHADIRRPHPRVPFYTPGSTRGAGEPRKASQVQVAAAKSGA